MCSIPNPFSANIRQSHEKSERFKEKGNTVENEGKIGRSGLCGWYFLLAKRFCDMEEELKRLKKEEELVGLRININKTKGMRVNVPNMQKLRLEETEIEEVGSFVYLGSVVSESRWMEEDVASRIKKVNCVFVQFYPVWRNLIISKEVKIRIFNKM